MARTSPEVVQEARAIRDEIREALRRLENLPVCPAQHSRATQHMELLEARIDNFVLAVQRRDVARANRLHEQVDADFKVAISLLDEMQKTIAAELFTLTGGTHLA
jgi:hypothetical protein